MILNCWMENMLYVKVKKNPMLAFFLHLSHTFQV